MTKKMSRTQILRELMSEEDIDTDVPIQRIYTAFKGPQHVVVSSVWMQRYIGSYVSRLNRELKCATTHGPRYKIIPGKEKRTYRLTVIEE